MPRALDSLVDRDDGAWPALERAVEQAAGRAHLLACNPASAEATVGALALSTRSYLGAMARYTGGLLAHGGWLRLLGGGCATLPGTLASWNGLGDRPVLPPDRRGIVVAHDAVGGAFLLCPRAPSPTVHYLAPDTLALEDLGVSYVRFVHWALGRGPATFYASLRWPGWADDLAALAPADALCFSPPLAVAGPPAVRYRRRAAVPAEDLRHMLLCMAENFEH